VFGKEIDVEVIGKDRHGHEVGNVHVGSRYVNAEMVRARAAKARAHSHKKGKNPEMPTKTTPR
jgi:hypothetical protein